MITQGKIGTEYFCGGLRIMETINYHGRNSVLSYLVGAFNAMLVDLGLSDTWTVVSANQPTLQGLQNNTIYIDIISKRRYGTQGTKSIKTDTGWYESSVWFEEMLVQVGGFLQRNPQADDVDTLTSSDVVGLLQGCVNSNNDMGGVGTGQNKYGVKKRSYFVENWMQVIKSTELRELDYETDSGLKEKLPQFDFVLVVEQNILKKADEISNIEIGTERI